MKALVVEDSEQYAAFLKRLLERGAFEVIAINTAERTLEIARRLCPDLIVIDWILGPGQSGIALLQAIRSTDRISKIPCVIMTGFAKSPEDECKALSAGANFFFTKDEFMGRAYFLLRHFQSLAILPSSTARYQLDELEFSPQSGVLISHGRKIRVHGKTAKLLELFLREPNVLHRSDFLWTSIWDEDTRNWRHTLDNKVSRLRRLLGTPWGSRLVSRKGAGYILELRG